MSKIGFYIRVPSSLSVIRIIAIIGIAIGTATLLVTLSIVSGFEKVYMKSILDFNAHIVVLKTGEFEDLTQAGQAIIDTNEQSKNSIVGDTPFLYREALVISNGTIKGIVVKGIDLETVQSVNKMKIVFWHKKDLNNGSIILGKALAEKLNIEYGKQNQEIDLIVPGKKKDQITIKLKVAGVFESGLFDYDSQFGLMNINNVREIFNTEDVIATGIELKLDDPKKGKLIAGFLNKRLPDYYDVITWDELNKDLFDALLLEKIVFSIIMGILVIVASFNIIGVIVLLIYYRTKEIAILRSLGMQQMDLKKIFIQSGFKLGLIGTVLGMFLGIIISFMLKQYHFITLDPEIYFLSTLPINISPFACIGIMTFSLFMCWLTSNLASQRVLKMNISDALRG